MVVRPIAPVGTRIRIAGPIVECRLVHEIGEPFRPGEPCKTHTNPFRREWRCEAGDITDPGKGIEKAPKPGQQQSCIDAERDERRRQRCSDIAEPAGLDPRIEFRRHTKNAHRGSEPTAKCEASSATSADEDMLDYEVPALPVPGIPANSATAGPSVAIAISS
jgi:hypothetical protein